MAKNLTDLTARTTTADSDLIHVNSGGTDYKETKINFLKGNLWHEFNTTTDICTQVEALPIGSYIGKISSYGHQSETGVPANDSYYVYAEKMGTNNIYIRLVSVGQAGTSLYRIKNASGWASSWTKEPSRSELDSRLSNNSVIDGCRVITSGSNFRYIRIKRESASTSFYGVGIAIIYSNERSCIFSIGPSTPNIKPLGTQTPTGTYSYSSGVNTAVIDLGASGQGLVILGGTLGRSANTTIELLASL